GRAESPELRLPGHKHQRAGNRGRDHQHSRQLPERLGRCARVESVIAAPVLMAQIRRPGVLLLGFIAALPGLTAHAAPASVILISVDTLRADRLSCYGGKLRTPHLDALARGGTLFSRVDSPVPMTLPAHMSLLSSTYPFVHGIEENGQQIAPGAVTLATVLKTRGYRTAAFIGGYVLDALFGLNQGFDIYDSPFHLTPPPGERPPSVTPSA